jgi:hypothetical protein
MYSDKLSSYHEDGSGSAIIVKNMKVNSLDGSIVRSQFQNLNANTNILRSLDIDTTISYGPTFLNATKYFFTFNFNFKSAIVINTITIQLKNVMTQTTSVILNTSILQLLLSNANISGAYTPDEGNYTLQAIINSPSTPELELTGNSVVVLDQQTNIPLTLR